MLNCLRLLVMILAVPEFKAESTTVHPRIFDERSSAGKIVVEVTENITLHLQKTSVLLPAVRMDRGKLGGMVHEVMNGRLIEKDLYTDAEVGASVTIHRKGNAVTLNGMVTDQLKIRPVPVSDRALHLSQPHVLEPIEMTEVDDTSENRTNKYIPPEAFVAFSSLPTHSSCILRGTLLASWLFLTFFLTEERAPNNAEEQIVYPEVYVAVDSHFAGDATNAHLLRYIMIFMAGVNLKLADLQAPKVQLRVVGVLIGDVMDRSYVWMPGTQYVDAQQTINNFFRHVGVGIGRPDIFFLLTGQDLIGNINNVYDPNLSGLSPLGEMCNWGRNALISEDKYDSFSGIEVATHEFGHMLGAPHDVFPQYESFCGWRLGYIMSYEDGGQRRHHFSPCSRYAIQQSLSTKSRTCFALTFTVDYLAYVPGVYPGKVADGLKFCRARHPRHPNIYFPKQALHTLRQCRVTCNVPQGPYGGYSYYLHHALDGTPCFEHFPLYICILGQCVYKEWTGR